MLVSGAPRQFGIGIGTLILAVNVVLIGGYTLGCHSPAPHRRRARRAGGPPRAEERHGRVSCLNRATLGVTSLFWVGRDLYVRLWPWASGSIRLF